MMKRNGILFVGLAVFLGWTAYAADPAPVTPVASAAASPLTGSNDSDESPGVTERTVEPKTAAGRAKKNTSNREKYRGSRLTNDESESVADRRRLQLTTGEDRAVDLDFPANGGANGITIGNPQVVATTLVKIGDKRQLVFKPLKTGESSVTVRDEDGSIRLIFTVAVSGNNLLRRAAEIRELLKDIEGVDVRIVGQRILVDGELLVPADYARLLEVVGDKTFSDLVLNLTTLSPIALKVLSDRIRQDIQVFAPKIDVRIVNGMLFLEGSTDSKEKALRAEVLAKLYLPEAVPGNPIVSKDPSAKVLSGRQMVQNFVVVDAPPPKKQDKLIRVTVHFVELTKDYNKTFGFKWEPGFSSDPQITIGAGDPTSAGTTTSSGTSFTATISSLFPKLKSAQDAGFARVLKTGTLIVRSGQPAKLTETTEYPYTITGNNGQIQGAKQTVGLEVAVTPKILGQTEDIELELDMNQSSVVGETTAGQSPTTANHAVKTKIYVKSAESAAVAGVTGQNVKTGFNKSDPQPGAFAGKTDPLFTLKHTKDYSKLKNQFVIFVTPQIIENASDGTQDMKKNFRVRVN